MDWLDRNALVQVLAGSLVSSRLGSSQYRFNHRFVLQVA
jgi:hypothetical protein